jgi:hypothetical protein
VLDIDKALELQVSGSAAINVGEGLLVATITGVELNLATMTVTDGTTTLTGASILSFTGTATLFAGIGGDLVFNSGLDEYEVVDGSIGFSASATLSLVTATGAAGDGTHAGDTYVGDRWGQRPRDHTEDELDVCHGYHERPCQPAHRAYNQFCD